MFEWEKIEWKGRVFPRKALKNIYIHIYIEREREGGRRAGGERLALNAHGMRVNAWKAYNGKQSHSGPCQSLDKMERLEK